MKIDLNARTVSPEINAWRLFPGSGYTFLPSFIDQKVGFLDFVGMELPMPLDKATDIIPRIAHSHAFKAAHKASSDAGTITLDLKDFRNARHTQNRGRLRQAIINFYHEAKAGDVLICPGPLNEHFVWVGEFLDNDVIYINYSPLYGSAKVPARNINWISRQKEGSLSGEMSALLRNQHPFTILPNSRYVEILALAYSSYVYKDRHVTTIFNGDDFLDVDSAFLGNISKLAAAACKKKYEGDVDLQSDLIDILLGNQDIQYSCSQESDIHSKGYTRLISATVVTLVIGALLTFYTNVDSSIDAEALKEQIKLVEVNNLFPNADPQCSQAVQEITLNLLRTMPIDKTLKLCQSGQESKRRAELRASPRVHKR